MIKKKYTEEQKELARFAKTMGHPAHVTILQLLAPQKCCFFDDIHKELPIAKAAMSQHLEELKGAGLIRGETETPRVECCINKENWETAKKMLTDFLGQPIYKKEGCCK